MVADSMLKFQPNFRTAMSGGSADMTTGNASTNGSDPLTNISTTPGSITFPPEPSVIQEPVCQWILYEDIAESRVRIWDLIILVPNSLFVMFLLWNLKLAINKLKQTSSPIFMAFYLLVCMVAVISVLRCIVGMTVNASVLAGDITDKVLWLVLRFFLLATELSVVVFGLAFGHLDSKTSIRRVLLVTTVSAFIYSCIQGSLEFTYPDPKFHVEKGAVTKNYDIFAHGGMIFWITSSAFFFVVYSVIFILPWTNLKAKLNLPSKKSFYYYALFLAFLNCAQTVGSSLLYSGVLHGMCVVDTTTYIYFTCFHPLVYGTFLRDFFKMSSQNIPFSYKYQIDEGQDEDTVSLPYQAAEDKYTPDNISDSGSFDSTHFDRHGAGFASGSVNADVYVHTGSYQNM
ncbi:transmembrane protein adipocyte-associated 1-like [Mercenaria mercenaria]|uniref:transmembrane protein adipocyte-associated 1-like n=1 Tax=Mercenaria mercenaria TaxID=6596 RepID=UPI001E1D4C16|nr:transmembrane protein adipocyte-associated 1-like [Mercenaria mercenaria]XP_045165262.1 transmembrane protein adipocyte-associated 1-like [Mercenaria mercenaria]